MLLAIDAGNTNIKLGLFEGPKRHAMWVLVREQLGPETDYGPDALRMLAQGNHEAKDLDAIIIASVVPQLNNVLQSVSDRYFGLTPKFVDHTANTGLKLLYDDPSQLGADRIADAVGAVEKYGAPCIVVDFGTATTFNAINAKREFLGGIIAPGLLTAASALFSRAAQLGPVEIEQPKKVIGTSTVEAMQSGIFYGYASLVDGLIERMLAEMEAAPQVIATGGAAPLMRGVSKHIHHFDLWLTLDGLRFIHERA
ncbi:MAG TPA: type III pantothenate kinase [Pyrinomonadaceae bacterium]|nr:type III pantothenate kinase [Pyrinomonadaceae bacterium]